MTTELQQLEVEFQRDPNFYFSFRTFQVEDTLFRVPRHLFPNADARTQLGIEGVGNDNDDDLVVLGDDIKKTEFLQLLRVVYPREYNRTETLDSNQWQVVFKLSKAFGMDAITAKAASQLRDSFFAGDPVDALLCAKENDLQDWMAPLIEKIVQENRDLTDDQLNRLGMGLAMRIAREQGAALRTLSTGSRGLGRGRRGRGGS